MKPLTNSQRRRKAVSVTGQDKLLRDTVRAIEASIRAGRDKGHTLSWSWVAKRGGISDTTLAHWRNRETRSGLTRTMNAALKAVGKTLVIADL